MFKINIFIKFALIAIGFILGILLTALYGFGYGWVFLLIGIIMLISYLFLGTIQSATEKIQIQDFDAADKMLNLTFKPDWLYTPLRSMYYSLKGSIAAYKKDNKIAEEYFQKAMSMKFNNDDEKAMVLMQMIGIQMQRQNWTSAQNLLSQLRKLNITQSIIKNQVADVEKAYASRGNLNVARSMGRAGMQQMMQGGGGGKRRRPIGR